jgi:hypothetical protein
LYCGGRIIGGKANWSFGGGAIEPGLASGQSVGVVLGLGGGVCVEKLVEQGLALGVGEGGGVGGGDGGGRDGLLLAEELVEDIVQVDGVGDGGRDAVGLDEVKDGAGGADGAMRG